MLNMHRIQEEEKKIRRPGKCYNIKSMVEKICSELIYPCIPMPGDYKENILKQCEKLMNAFNNKPFPGWRTYRITCPECGKPLSQISKLSAFCESYCGDGYKYVYVHNFLANIHGKKPEEDYLYNLYFCEDHLTPFLACHTGYSTEGKIIGVWDSYEISKAMDQCLLTAGPF